MNLFDADDNLQAFLRRTPIKLTDQDISILRGLGTFAGGRLDAQAELSQDYPPYIKDIPDSPANPQKRVNRLTINPEYEACQQEIMQSGTIARCFVSTNPAPHLLPFLTQYLVSKSDISTGCPFAMTHPTALVLDKLAPTDIKNKFLPEILKTDGSATVCGTWATERHSGSDVGGTVTQAVTEDGQKAQTHRLYGHQYFTSAFGFKRFMGMKTARPEGAASGTKGLGLYLVPSHIDEDWQIPNALEITSLKRKLGTKGLPTAEVNLNGAVAFEIAPEGKGIHAMMLALGCSRVHNAMAAAGSMHRSYLESLSWTANHETFGKPVIERPMIQKRILDIATQWKAGTALACEAAISFDAAMRDPTQEPWMRLVTALAKYKTADQAVWCAQKTMELFAGNGYTEDYPAARLLRDALVLPVWEGPEQVQALELMRLIGGSKGGAPLFTDRINNTAQALPADMGQEASTLASLGNSMRQSFALLQAAPQKAEAVADEFLHNMANILAYTLLCEEAAWELEHENNASKLLFARRFYDGMMKTGLSAPNLEDSYLQENFAKVVKTDAIKLAMPETKKTTPSLSNDTKDIQP